MTSFKLSKVTAYAFPVLGLLVLLMICYQAMKVYYFDVVGELHSSIEETRDKVKSYEADLETRVSDNRIYRGYVDRTLGNKAEEVIHELRTRLNQIGHAVGLDKVVVSTTSVKKVESPADREFPRSMRGRVDFYELVGELSGRGRIDQVVRAVELVDSEPYLKQVNRVSFTPRKNGEEVDLSVTITTIYFDEIPAKKLVETDLNIPDTYVAIGKKNVFRIPPPPPEPEPEPVIAEKVPDPTPIATPPPPPPPPYGDWVVTAIVSIEGKTELWLHNRKTNENKHLQPGQKIYKAIFVSIEGKEAVIELDGVFYRVDLGMALDKRRS